MGSRRGRPPGSKNKIINHNVKSLGKIYTDQLMKLPKKERYGIIEQALRKNYGFITGTAESLGVCRSTLNKIMKDDYWKDILLDIRESIADKFETLFIKNSLELEHTDAFRWAKEYAHLSTTLKARGWLKDPEVEVNTNVNFTFKFNDGDSLDSPGQTIS